MNLIIGVKLSFGAGDFESALDIGHDHILSFEFKTLKKEDPFLQSTLSFLRNREVSQRPQASWLKTESMHQDLCHKIKQFSSFCEANSGSKEVSFIVTDNSEEEVMDDPTNKGAVIMHYENGTPFGEFDPPGRPGKPKAISVEHDSIELEWKAPRVYDKKPNCAFKIWLFLYQMIIFVITKIGNLLRKLWSFIGPNAYQFTSSETPDGPSSINAYTVSLRCINESLDTWPHNQEIKGNETTIIFSQLEPDTKYVAKVRAECSLGHSEESEISEIIQTKQPLVDIRLQNIIAQSAVIEEGPPEVYEIRARPLRLTKRYSNIAKMEFGTPVVVPRKPTRVLMLVGATGAGKSTLINAMVNYFLGVKWKHKFRLKLIHDEVSHSQAHSQTQTITAYTFYWYEGSPLNCNLTIIDTPGFGDTRGLERDQEITRNIREFFEMEGSDGLDSLHAIGFVTQASLARLTPTQKYISDSILSIFGKDIRDNIFIMTTFADGADPPVMEAVREAKIPHSGFFPFNNSALFFRSSESSFSKMFWDMGYASLKDFFIKFQQAGAVSLQMTREVLKERQQLETIINGIQPQINAGLAKIDELRQEEQMLKANESKIIANKDFKYKIPVTKQRQIPLPHGQYVTNCANCHSTCHDDCAFADDKDKWKCSAMDDGDQSNATCKVCVGRCTWRKHFNNGYTFEFYEEMETRTSQELYERYTEAKTAKDKLEYIIGEMEKELQDLQRVVLYNIRRARECLQHLDEIALKPNPLTEVEYIELLIESEKQQKRSGWKKRIEHFYEVRQQAELLATVKDEETFEQMARESTKTLWENIKKKSQSIFNKFK